MRNRNRLATIFITALALVVVSGVACAKKEPRQMSRLLVTGEADVKTPPDTAVIVLSVVTQGKRALDAQQQNARKSEAVMQAVKGAAGANPEVQTSDYSLQPQREWWGGMPKIIGYEARNSVTVTTGALDNVGAVLDAATTAGANSVDSVSFILREGDKARGQTLADATKQAMSKAEAMAKALGGRVVRVVEEQEGGFADRPTTVTDELSTYSSMNANMNLSAGRVSRRTPVEAGSLNVRSQVQLIVEIEAQP